jgi:hypothetical protein
MKRWVASRLTVATVATLAASLWALDASAQEAPGAPGVPDASTSAQRSGGWQAVTTITAVSALATQVLMPRVFYAGPETTVGWKSRFHASLLAPTLVLTGITILNEYALKSAIGAKRPGCSDPKNPCVDSDPYETMSSHSFAGFSAFGQGTAIFLVDTMKYSNGRINVGSAIGNVALPLVLAGVTAAGRVAGNWEDAGSVILSSGIGLVVGAVTGLVYATFVQPECGYSGNLLCW